MDTHRPQLVDLLGEPADGVAGLAPGILLVALNEERKEGAAKVSGSIRWKGQELLTLKESAWLKLRGREISFVPQSPMSSLNPALRIETQLGEAWKLHQSGGKQECQKAILAALENVSLPAEKEFLRRYPSEISVGQAQRVLIAMAILHRPSLLIADEPTSALDAITQSEILDLFSHLNRKLGMSILYISHDLPSVASICDRIAIVNDGEIVECAPPQQIFFAPTHAFTRRLVAALPSMPQMPEKRRGASA